MDTGARLELLKQRFSEMSKHLLEIGGLVDDLAQSIKETIKQQIQDALKEVHEGIRGGNQSTVLSPGSQEIVQPLPEGSVAEESVKGRLVNDIRGLRIYEDIFTDTELSQLNDFVNQLRVAGRTGQLSGETFLLLNQHMRGYKTESIRLGVPIFPHISHIEPIPALLQCVIENLIQWHLLPEDRKPNSCIINFFDDGEYSQPYVKPPHIVQPFSTLLLSESTMAFGLMLVNEGGGNCGGPLVLSLKQGSLLVMWGHHLDTSRYVMCASPNKRIIISFFRINNPSMNLWQPGVPTPYTMPNNYGPPPMNMMIPRWGLVRAPMVMYPPVRPVLAGSTGIQPGGTGVFVPPQHNIPPRHNIRPRQNNRPQYRRRIPVNGPQLTNMEQR